ncbi:Transposase zinc-binding domain-containing protein [Halanaerobium congolense]|uniref:IS91 family transposase n=1 Tax=Halanaerobium congolense TaxID=54121 RepID=UPI000888BC77|nr:transposase [Halanaerobium congolense]SDM68561.1 Transposase zinc-binding domain-containing protein [Halanaerobium congolense]
MSPKQRRKRIKVKTILNDHWEEFKIKHLPGRVPADMLNHVIDQVEKSMECGNPENGYAKYKCLDCGEEHIVSFSCKSRFCSRCGKVYVDKWVDKQVDMILDVSHRHMVFTVPEELRGYIYWQRDIIKELSDKVAELIQRYIDKKGKIHEYEAGIITVVHTFGRDMSFNPHVHALIAEGALDKYHQWSKVGYFSYKYLRKAWQKVLLDIFKERFSDNQKVQNLIKYFYIRYKEGFYVNAESRMNSARGAAKYIGRYLARPAIAEYRILEYDGKKVRFWYEDHKTKKRVELEMSAMKFIGRIIMHIPPKYFKMTRRYGLYRRGYNKRVKKIVALWKYMKRRQLRLIMHHKKTISLSWRERMIKSFGKDPVRCKNCGKEMVLYEIWHPLYDFLYHIEHTDDSGRYIKSNSWEVDPRYERKKLARKYGDPIPFPGRHRQRVV